MDGGELADRGGIAVRSLQCYLEGGDTDTAESALKALVQKTPEVREDGQFRRLVKAKPSHDHPLPARAGRGSLTTAGSRLSTSHHIEAAAVRSVGRACLLSRVDRRPHAWP
jgi:hypothetical protein